MRLLTECRRTAILLLMAAAPAAMTAQLETNPLEYEAIREG